MRRSVTLLGVGIGVITLSVNTSLPAHADPACASVSVAGTVTGQRQLGPYCVPTPRPVLCADQAIGLRPTLEVTVMVCVPV